MKICVISSTVFPVPVTGYAGLEHIAWLTAKGLAERGHLVALAAPDGSHCPGVQMIHFGPAGQTDEKAAYERYWQALPSFDCVIDHSWSKWPWNLKREGRLKAPVLSVLHAPVNTMLSGLPPGVDKPCVVCISHDQRQHFEALFNRPARTCWNGVDGGYYRPLGLPRSGRFLFLARFSRIKNPLGAILACKEAGVGLDLIGDTSITNEPDYLAECRRLCDGTQIRLVGPASRGNCVWWFSRARALIHPVKEFREPFGLAPVEAMLCGCPVIAWNNGAMRETVGGITDAGWLVTSDVGLVEAIRDAANPENVPEGMRQRCRQHALQFSVQNMVARYEELCHEAVDTGGW